MWLLLWGNYSWWAFHSLSPASSWSQVITFSVYLIVKCYQLSYRGGGVDVSVSQKVNIFSVKHSNVDILTSHSSTLLVKLQMMLQLCSNVRTNSLLTLLSSGVLRLYSHRRVIDPTSSPVVMRNDPNDAVKVSQKEWVLLQYTDGLLLIIRRWFTLNC